MTAFESDLETGDLTTATYATSTLLITPIESGKFRSAYFTGMCSTKRSHSESLAQEESETPGYSHVGAPADEEKEDEEEQQKKRRRGMTEKKRRDRINDLLSQLQELIPSASERRDAGKLEKAELLEMAVVHMRNKVILSKDLCPSTCTELPCYQTAAHGNAHWMSPASATAAGSERRAGADEFRQFGFIPVHAPLGIQHNLTPRPLPVLLPSPVDDVMVRGVERSCCIGCFCDEHHLL